MAGGGGAVFARGPLPPAEKAPAHMHAAFARGRYDLAEWAKVAVAVAVAAGSPSGTRASNKDGSGPRIEAVTEPTFGRE